MCLEKEGCAAWACWGLFVCRGGGGGWGGGGLNINANNPVEIFE